MPAGRPAGNGDVVVQRADALSGPESGDAENEEVGVAFDRMSEEDLLAGIEGLVPPEKSDDF